MAALNVLSGNQMQAVSGRRARPILGDLMEASTGDLPARMAAKQREEEAKIRDRELGQRDTALALEKEQQADAERAAKKERSQQMLSTGVSMVGQGALLAETISPGILTSLVGGSSGAAAAGTAGAAAAGTAGATAAGTAGGAAATAGGAGAAGAGGAAGAAGASLGATAGVAAVGAGVGYGVGKLVNMIPGDSKGARTGKGLGGAALGAAAGFAIGGPIGAVAGGIFGGLGGGGLCILHEAGYGKGSPEVQIARAFRDTLMTKAQLRAYYATYQPVANRMHRDPAFQADVRTQVTDRLVRYGAALMQMPYPTKPSVDDVQFAKEFLRELAVLGADMPPFTRHTGEVV